MMSHLCPYPTPSIILTAMKAHSEDELSEELNQKLNELWTDAAQKRRHLINTHLPDYSRMADPALAEKQLLGLREQLQQQAATTKHKDLEIEQLKQIAAQLANDKKQLLRLRNPPPTDPAHSPPKENLPHLLNESSIAEVSKQHYESSIKKLRNKPTGGEEERTRLLELLRSTAEYRSFVFYYDSNQLSYLKRLQSQHRKNCSEPASQRERAFWAPAQVVERVGAINRAYSLGLNPQELQKTVGKVKDFYQHNMQLRLRRLKGKQEEKLRRKTRQGQNEVPYDIVQICRLRERAGLRGSAHGAR